MCTVVEPYCIKLSDVSNILFTCIYINGGINFSYRYMNLIKWQLSDSCDVFVTTYIFLKGKMKQ